MRIGEEIRLGSRVAALSATHVSNLLDSPGSQCYAPCVGSLFATAMVLASVNETHTAILAIVGLIGCLPGVALYWMLKFVQNATFPTGPAQDTHQQSLDLEKLPGCAEYSDYAADRSVLAQPKRENGRVFAEIAPSELPNR